MAEHFITNILVENSRNVKDLEIPLSTNNRQHLILTGRNGAGKTSLLLEIKKYLTQVIAGKNIQEILNNTSSLENQLQNVLLSPSERSMIEGSLSYNKDWIPQTFGGTKIQFSDDSFLEQCQSGEFILAYFDAKRQTSNLYKPSGINKVELQKNYGLNGNANTQFIQYIVNLKADRSFAKDDNENATVEKIDNWFKQLENRLKIIFDVEELELIFDRKNYTFEIVTEKGEPFGFDHLSDGYSAIISIVTELLLRMEAHNAKSYDLEGIVLIDEIETHLHVDLQKKILPFLTDFFPKIQFIVTTHSPFVLSSLANATICDLETRVVLTDLSSYSYDTLLEGYFETDKYSEELKHRLVEFEKLLAIKTKTPAQEQETKILRDYFAQAPKYLSKELVVKLQQIELDELTNKKS